MQEEKLSKLREVVPISSPKAEPEDSTSISTPTKEEVAEEGQVQGLTRIQHYLQYIRATAGLGETLPLGEMLPSSTQPKPLSTSEGQLIYKKPLGG